MRMVSFNIRNIFFKQCLYSYHDDIKKSIEKIQEKFIFIIKIFSNETIYFLSL